MSTGDDTARHQHIKALFLEALDVPEDQRHARLENLVEGDDALKNEVLSLLAAHTSMENADGLDSPLVGLAGPTPVDPMIGRLLGPWKLLERIGEGGMGAVYTAERVDGAYERTVAIKLLRAGSDVPLLAERLNAERKLLAGLDHPHIARLYDGGVTEEGLPYLALEYVDGMPITGFCGTHKLGTSARIRLFLQVCDAVAYAHRNLIVHRDLKPSNILVTEDGQAKLLDFGIAKLLEQTDEASVLTRTGTSAMTPAYAAPEQILNTVVTTATDVYSLGVLLYELLTNNRPYQLSGKTAAEIEHIVCVAEPDAPSASGNNLHLRGDLDTIVLKALAKEPERRYASAQALADDLNRQAEGHPVNARAATRGYRVRKFVKRHKVGVTAAVALLLALVGGLGATLWQARVASHQRDLAERQFETARALSQTLLFDVYEEIAVLPGSTPARELIVTESLAYLDHLRESAEGDRELLNDIAHAYRRIGDVLGNPSNNNLGRVQDAMSAYRNGLRSLPFAAPNDSIGQASTRMRAILFEKLGDVHAHVGNIDSALFYLGIAAEHFQQNVELEPDNPDHLLALAIENVKLGDYSGNPNFPNNEDRAAALAYYGESLELLRRASLLDPENDRVVRFLGIVHERLGTTHAAVGDLVASEEAFRESLGYREALWESNRLEGEARRDVGIAHEKLGLTFQQQGRLQNAFDELIIAHGHYSAIAAADPENVNAQTTLAVGEMQLGALMFSAELPSFSDAASAQVHYRQAQALLRAVLAIDTSNVRVQGLLDEAGEALQVL